MGLANWCASWKIVSLPKRPTETKVPARNTYIAIHCRRMPLWRMHSLRHELAMKHPCVKTLLDVTVSKKFCFDGQHAFSEHARNDHFSCNDVERPE